ncbi:hypothetical protein [Halosegnis marinus]|uniref:Uncharacterized protein n=1 Tax=Halosegnis marinus TaxID=3034023 RepID=A0ABD5ZN68_9EURY|nr:hypothetical protein [Halosegnis sp. DT85]
MTPDPDFALFVGGFVAALFVLAAGFLYLLGGGAGATLGLAGALAALGGVFLVLGLVGAGLLRLAG